MAMRFHQIVLAAILALSPAAASAQQGLSHMAIEGNLGISSFSGDLSAESAAPTYGMTVAVGQHTWSNSSSIAKTLGGLGSLWNLNLTSIASKTKSSNSFPFNQHKSFSVLATSISPTLCALTEAPLQACFGVGWEEFDVQQGSDNEQIYGTTLWSLAIGQYMSEELHAGVKLNYRSVTQTVSGTRSSFAVLSVLLSVGWQFKT
jgi:hypothetical protein